MKKFLLRDSNILILIIINSLLIFFMGFDNTPLVTKYLSILDNIISTIFVLEIITKIRHFGYKGYFSDNWNKFDFGLVAISIPSLLIFAFGLDMTDVSYLLIFRTLRIFKVFRFFKFIPNIDKLIEGVMRSLKASILILVSFVIYIFIVGMISHSLFNHSELFCDPGTSIYSTIKIFTLEGWYEFPDELVIGKDGIEVVLIRLYFVSILLSGGIIGLSMINSIFVDVMVSDNNDDLEEKVDRLESKIDELKDILNRNRK